MEKEKNYPVKANLCSKLLAILLVALLGGVAFHSIDQSMLSEMNSMSADAYLKKARDLHNNSYIFDAVLTFILVGISWVTVETSAYLLRRLVWKSST
jgi:hypothetical protein